MISGICYAQDGKELTGRASVGRPPVFKSFLHDCEEKPDIFPSPSKERARSVVLSDGVDFAVNGFSLGDDDDATELVFVSPG